MRAYARTMLVVSIALVLVPANAFTILADEPTSDALAVRWVMAGIIKNAASSEPIIITPESTLRTGDKIKVYLKAIHKCFFYFFYHNPEGQLQLIYPETLPSAALASGTRLTVPRGDHWFELDDQTGTETFHVLISPTPLLTIETLYAEYRRQMPGNEFAAARLIAAIERLRRQQRPLSSNAERPLSIGGTLRGDANPDAEATESLLDHLAEDISTAKVFCRTYAIEHH